MQTALNGKASSPNRALEAAKARMETEARRAQFDQLKTLAKAYRRKVHLPKALLGQPHVDRLAAQIVCDRDDEEIIARIRRAKDGELKRCQEGHWTADWNRLRALKAAYIAERLSVLQWRAMQPRLGPRKDAA